MIQLAQNAPCRRDNSSGFGSSSSSKRSQLEVESSRAEGTLGTATKEIADGKRKKTYYNCHCHIGNGPFLVKRLLNF
jgi:hypothetical protein